jgi:hypothetical protein
VLCRWGSRWPTRVHSFPDPSADEVQVIQCLSPNRVSFNYSCVFQIVFLSTDFSTKNFAGISHLPTRATLPAHIIFPNLVTLIIFGK